MMCISDGCTRVATNREWCRSCFVDGVALGSIEKKGHGGASYVDGVPYVLARFKGRLTYRMLDYWCRQGWISIEHDAQGSGTGRRFTEREVDAIGALLDRYEELHAGYEAMQSGEFFRAALNRQMAGAA